MTEPKRYLVTAALPYANGPVHIGHLAGCYLPADIYVRYLKAQGKDVLFICGSDEHGVPITIKAKKEGISPQQVVDKYDGIMKNAFKEFGIDFSYYGRTSSAEHHQTAQRFFITLHEKGVFKEEITKQYFDEEANQFLADRYITGICPRCGNQQAYGDQCEKCGTSLSPTDLINPKSALSGSTPVLKETKNWFLPMGQLQQTTDFQEYIKRFEHWKSNIKGQCQSWLTEGLQSRAMTRDLDWGVPVPIEGAEGKVLYVWFDAPIGYISATKEYFLDKSNKNDWELYWKNQDTALIHFIGKDNIVFHAIIFPMMLISHGNYILPTNIPANEFLNLEGDKISTSRNWAVWLHEYLQDFPNRQDELRFVLTAIAPETKDSEFTWKDFQTRVNSELVSIFGNFVNRVLVLIEKHYQGKVPSQSALQELKLLEAKKQCFEHIGESLHSLSKNLDTVKLREAQANFIDIARAGNKYLAETEPWKLIKTDEESVKAILYDALQICAKLAIAAEPFLPHTSLKLKAMLDAKHLKWKDLLKENILYDGHQVLKPDVLYSQVTNEEIEHQIEKLMNTKKTNEELRSEMASENNETVKQQPVKPNIDYDDFDKIDLRVGKILEAERVPKADKLLKLVVDLGFEKRTILSGIAEYYIPEELMGKLVTVVANLAPRKIRGIESQGMLLMAGNDFGKLYNVSTEKEIELGSVVK